jgi:hypothetical protein
MASTQRHSHDHDTESGEHKKRHSNHVSAPA